MRQASWKSGCSGSGNLHGEVPEPQRPGGEERRQCAGRTRGRRRRRAGTGQRIAAVPLLPLRSLSPLLLLMNDSGPIFFSPRPL